MKSVRIRRFSGLYFPAFGLPHLDWIRRDTEYLSVSSPNAAVRMQENADQKNSEYGHFSYAQCATPSLTKIQGLLKAIHYFRKTFYLTCLTRFPNISLIYFFQSFLSFNSSVSLDTLKLQGKISYSVSSLRKSSLPVNATKKVGRNNLTLLCINQFITMWTKTSQ